MKERRWCRCVLLNILPHYWKTAFYSERQRRLSRFNKHVRVNGPFGPLSKKFQEPEIFPLILYYEHNNSSQPSDYPLLLLTYLHLSFIVSTMLSSLFRSTVQSRVRSINQCLRSPRRALATAPPSESSTDSVAEPPMLRKIRSDLKDAMRAKDKVRFGPFDSIHVRDVSRLIRL